jgi:TatD DNase family protein
MLIDTHCHLDHRQLEPDRDAVLARAREAGVGLMVTIGTRVSRVDEQLALAEAHPDVVVAVGTHPHEAGEEGQDDPAALLALAAHPKVVAIGESGLDYYYDRSPRDRQRASFVTHVRAAQASGLPLVVHTRDADDDTMDLLEAMMGEAPFRGVIHCYSSSRRLAERAVAIGLHLGIGGILTFPRSEELRATVRAMPHERLILETDAPYLAPVPLRGKRNEPAFVARTAVALAQLLELPVAAVAELTTANALRLFAKAAQVLPRAA